MSELKLEDFLPLNEDSNYKKRFKSVLYELQNFLQRNQKIPYNQYEKEIKALENFAIKLKREPEEKVIDKILAPFKEQSLHNFEFLKPSKEPFELSFEQSEKIASNCKNQLKNPNSRNSRIYDNLNHYQNEFDISNNFEIRSTTGRENNEELDPLFTRDSKLLEIRKRITSRVDNKKAIIDLKKNFCLADCLNTRESIREIMNKENDNSMASLVNYSRRRQGKEEVKKEFNDTLRSLRKSKRTDQSCSSSYKRNETPRRNSFLDLSYTSKKKSPKICETKLQAWNTRIKTSFEARFSHFKFR